MLDNCDYHRPAASAGPAPSAARSTILFDRTVRRRVFASELIEAEVVRLALPVPANDRLASVRRIAVAGGAIALKAHPFAEATVS